MLLDKFSGDSKVLGCETVILSQLNLRFKPKLGLAMTTVNMDMHSRLFAREEKEAKTSLTEYRWTHSFFPLSNPIVFSNSANLGSDRKLSHTGCTLRFTINQ